MKGKRIGLLVFFCIMLTNIASAATIYGTIYDFELNRAESIRVSVNTADEQQTSGILIWFAIGATIIVLLVIAYRVNKLLKRISQTINDKIEVKTEPATTEIKQEIDAKKDTQPSQSPVEQLTASKEALPDELQQA